MPRSSSAPRRRRAPGALAAISLATIGLAATPAAALGQRPVTIGLAAGAVAPTGDLADAAEVGFNVLGTLGVGAPSVNIGLRIDGMWSQLAAKEPRDDDLRILGAAASLVYTLPGVMVKPYLIGGIGYYSLKFTDGGDSADEVGYNAGLGVTFGLAGFNSFVEVRYHRVDDALRGTADGAGDRNAAFIPVTFGILF